MPRQEIQPHRVTRPFQLLAAWLVTLIALDGAFLAGARMVAEPRWVAGTLSIAAVANVPIFLLSMFLLQTRFRPEMQDDRYYSTYLKEGRETSRVAAKLTERMTASGLDIQSLISAQRKLPDMPKQSNLGSSLFSENSEAMFQHNNERRRSPLNLTQPRFSHLRRAFSRTRSGWLLATNLSDTPALDQMTGRLVWPGV
jgi:hypothetical protein